MLVEILVCAIILLAILTIASCRENSVWFIPIGICCFLLLIWFICIQCESKEIATEFTVPILMIEDSQCVVYQDGSDVKAVNLNKRFGKTFKPDITIIKITIFKKYYGGILYNIPDKISYLVKE